LDQAFREIENFYHTAKSSYRDCEFDQKYPLTELWARQNMQVLLDIIHNEADPISKIATIQRTFMFSAYNSDEDIKNRVVDWYIGYLLSRGIYLTERSLDLQESPYSNSLNCVYRDGRLLSPDFLRTLVFCLEIQKYCIIPDYKFNVLEIGAGYGALARTLKLCFPRISYVIIDIPESLYFSASFLRLNFPDSKCCFVSDLSCLSGPIGDFDFVFVPTLFAEQLVGNEFELFCNTASLGEMKNSVIRYWMEFVQNRVTVKYFFGLNRFLNTVYPKGDPKHQTFRLNENRSSVTFDEGWRILHWELEPAFTRCPYMETEVSRNLEVIAERLPKARVNKKENRRRSQELLEGVAKQDWIVCYEADNTMKLRDNILAPDLTMQGTLFALWDSIRLDANPVNVSIMLKYLHTLTRGKPFEEMFYYEDLLSVLCNASSSSVGRPSELTSSTRGLLHRLKRAALKHFTRRTDACSKG
jgi:hypothetical protein